MGVGSGQPVWDGLDGADVVGDVFADATYAFTDRFEMSAGLRYTRDDKTTGYASSVERRSALGALLGLQTGAVPAAQVPSFLAALANPSFAVLPAGLFPLRYGTPGGAAAVADPALLATDLADYLVRKHVSFREAHGAVGALVREAEEKGIEMTALPSESFVKAHHAFESDVLHELQARTSLAHRDIAGGTGATAVAAQLQQAKAAVG